MRSDIIKKLHELEHGDIIILSKEEQEWIVRDWLQTHTKRKITKEQVFMEENADIVLEDES